MSVIHILATQSVTLHGNELNFQGNPVTAPLTWVITDQPTKATLTPSADGLSCVYTPTNPGAVLSSSTTVKATAPNGVSGIIGVTIDPDPSQPTAITITADAPV